MIFGSGILSCCFPGENSFRRRLSIGCHDTSKNEGTSLPHTKSANHMLVLVDRREGVTLYECGGAEMKTGRLLTFPFEISLYIVIMSARLISVTSMFWHEPSSQVQSVIHLIIVCCNYYKRVRFLLFVVLISYRDAYCYSLLLLLYEEESTLHAMFGIFI